MERDARKIGSTKRKLFDESSYDDRKAKKPRLQVTIPRLQVSQEQLQRLRKISLRHQKEPLINNKEDDKENVASVNASASATTSTTETALTETTSTVKRPVRTVEESPTRHRLTNLLDGSSLSPYQDSTAHTNEENVKSINCTGEGQLNNAEDLSGPLSTVENLFCSQELVSPDNGLSPLMHKEDCITVPCCPNVVSRTIMQVKEGCTETSSDNGSQADNVVTASVEDKGEDYETNQSLQTTMVEEVPTVPEEGNNARSRSPGSCDVFGELSNGARPNEKTAENGNAKERHRIIDYASHYDTLEAMNDLLTKFTEEKRARTELEEHVSYLEKQNDELVTECEKLKQLVNDFLPSSKIKNETISRGIQINVDLSLRRGKTVDRATSPLRTIRAPSPELTLVSFSTGCQTVDRSLGMKSTACQTDPPEDTRLQVRSSAQGAVPVRVQGIVAPSVHGRVPVKVPNYTQGSNPVQMACSQTPPPLQQQSAKVTVSQPLGMQSQQGHFIRLITAHHLANMGQTTGYNNVAGPHAATQVRISRPTGTALYAQVPQNHFTPMSCLTTTQISGSQALLGSNPSVNTGVYDTAIQKNVKSYNTLAAQQATRPDVLNQSTGQRLNLNTATLSPLFTQNQLLAHSSASLSHQALSSAQSTSQNSRLAQFVGAQQYSNQQQATPTSSLQVSTNARSSIPDVIPYPTNDTRRQITTTTTQSVGHLQQAVGASLPRRTVYNQVTTPQHIDGLPLQHQASSPFGSNVHQNTSRNSQQSLRTFLQSRVGYNQGALPQQTGGLLRHQVPQPEGSQTMPHTQTSCTSSLNSQQPLGTFPQRRVGSQSGGLRILHQVSQPEASQARLHVQPNSASVQQKNVNSLIGQKSDQNTSRTSNTDNHLANRLLENAIEGGARSRVEAPSLYNEVQRVYNQLQKSLSEVTFKQEQSNTTRELLSLDHELNQLQTSKNTLPSNKQPPDATHRTNSLYSVSEQGATHCHTSANQLPSQVSSSQSLSMGAKKRLNHFSQEADSKIPLDASPGNANYSSPLDSLAVRQTGDKDQNNPRKDTLYRLSVNNDPYKVPSKTPSGALEDVVKKLLALQKEIDRTENGSGTEHVSSNSLAESTDGTYKAASTTKSPEFKQTGMSESTTSSERDSNNESMQHYPRNPEHNSAKTISLNQGTDTQGRIKDQDNNNPCSSGNQDKPAEGTSVSTSSHNVLDIGFDEMQAENEPASSVPEGNGSATEVDIENFPATDGEEQDSANCEEQDNRDSDRQDSSSPCPSKRIEGTENKTYSPDAEHNNSSQDIYVDLMSPIIPRIATARRVRSHSEAHTAKDLCDVDTSISSIDVAPTQNVNSDDHSMECGPEPKQSSNDREQIVKDALREDVAVCATVPVVDVHCSQQEHGRDTVSNSEKENTVNDQEVVPLSSGDIMEEMQLEQDIQVSSSGTIVTSSTGSIVTALPDAQQAPYNAKIQEMPKPNISEEQLSTKLSDGQSDLPTPVPVLNSKVKSEASDGPCMGGVAQGSNKVDEGEQYQKYQLNPEAIPKQDFVCLNSTFQKTPVAGDMDETKKTSMRLPLPSSVMSLPNLVKKNVDEKRLCRVPVESKKNMTCNNTNTAINDEPSPPFYTSPLPVPRVALRVMNGNTVIMWDLPPDNKITDISLFEVYVFLINKDGRRLQQNQTWIKVGQMKAMPLPMACTIRQIIQKNVLYYFSVRAVGNNELPGPLSEPCCVTYL